MRFGIKTAPQHTTWEDMLAVWRARRRDRHLRVGVELRPLLSDLLRLDGPVSRGVDDARRDGECDSSHPARRDRHREHLSASGGPREHGRDRRRDLERPPRARHRGGVEPAGVRRLRHHASAVAGALRHVRRSVRGVDQAAVRHDIRLRGSLLPAHRHARCEPKSVQRPHPPICIGGGGEKRTLRAVAKYAQHWNVPAGDVAGFQRKRAVLGEHCEAIGRHLSTITTSTHIRYDAAQDLGAFVDDVAAWGEGGLDLGIIYLPPPHRPDTLETIADALGSIE